MRSERAAWWWVVLAGCGGIAIFFHALSRGDEWWALRSTLSTQSPDKISAVASHACGPEPNRRKANAAIVVLARNEEVWGIVSSMKQLEDRFNHWAGYDYVFLNDKEFDDNFKQFTSEVTNSKCSYGQIEKSHWEHPEWITEEMIQNGITDMVAGGVIHGDSVSYRNMCRFNSGFFYRHPLLAEYDYYWRLEPDVQFFCDITYDPFLKFQDEKKVYGFVISPLEWSGSIKTLWSTTMRFADQHPELIPEQNAANFLSDDGGATYNMCHFWSNFEIGDLNFFRAEPYSKFFDYLDRAGGFYTERWGDAPVHSIGVALLARMDQIHFFDDIGYRHLNKMTCPRGELHARNKCWCNPDDDPDGYSHVTCIDRWLRLAVS